MMHSGWPGLEALEPRLLMSAPGDGEPDVLSGLGPMVTTATDISSAAAAVDQLVGLAISPIWFEDLLGKSRLSSFYGPVGVHGFPQGDESHEHATLVTASANQWIVQLNTAGIGLSDSVAGVGELLGLDQVGWRVVRGLGMSGMVLIEADSDTDVDHVLGIVGTHDLVDYVEPDLVLQMQAIPNDAFLSSLWGLHNFGQNGGTLDADIDAPEAWQLSTGGPEVVVGVIDSGVDYTHPDLANNMWTNLGEIAGNGIDDDSNGFIDDVHGFDFVNNDGDPMDDHGHGTHVAGTIAGVGNNGLGVVGVNWSSSVMALKFLNSEGSGYSSDAVRALNYATMMRTQYGVNVRVTNNSWGGVGRYAVLENAILESLKADMLFVAAAGNDGEDTDQRPHYPSTYDLGNIISVAATDRNDDLASFSNYGLTTVHVAAPGRSILSTVPGGGHASFSGTSMATPYVAGVVALAWSAVPSANSEQIRDAIFQGVDRLEMLTERIATGGRLNAHQTLLSLGLRPNPDPNPNPGPDPPPPGDSYEIDDTPQHATEIAPDGALQYHSIHVGSDVDWVRFTLDELADVVMTTGGSAGDARMWLYAAGDLHNFLAFDDDGGSGLFSKITCNGADALGAGTYYVKIDEVGNNQSIDFYTIRVQATPVPTGDAYEVDDSAGQALVIATDGTPQTHSIHIGTDVDWVAFTPDLRSDVVLRIDGQSGDMRMWLYGPNSTSLFVAYDDDSGPGLFPRIERSGSQGLEPGKYYVKVDEFGNNDTIENYTIQVTASAAAPDLAVQKVDFVVGTYAIGQTMDLMAQWANVGTADVQSSQSYTVEARLSANTIWGDDDDVVVATTFEGDGLDTSVVLERSVRGQIPEGVTEGDYYLAVWVDSGQLLSELDETNNVWWSSAPTVSLAPTLVLAFGGRTVAHYTDANGVEVAVALRGSGHGEVRIQDGQPARIIAFDTTGGSSLNIKSRSKIGQTVVSNIAINGSLRSLSARTAELSGDLTVNGGLFRLMIKDVTGQGTIRIGKTDGRHGAVTIRLDRVTDASIDSAMPIRTLVVNQWLDDDGTPDNLTAPSLKRLVCRGDFGADLHLTDDGVPLTLGKMVVAGRFYDADVYSAGHIGQVTVGAMRDASLFAGMSDGAANMPEFPTDFNVLATIRSLKIRGLVNSSQALFVNSNVAAASLGRVNLTKVMTENNGGSFGIVADSIKVYQRRRDTEPVRLSRLDTPGTPDVAGDYEVRIL